MLRCPSPNPMDVTIYELKLIWLVYTYIIILAIVGRLSFNSNDEQDTMDGELMIRVLQLMNLTDARLPQPAAKNSSWLFSASSSKFERCASVSRHKRLSDVFGLSHEQMLLSLINRKIITNLKFNQDSNAAISEVSVNFNSLREDSVHANACGGCY